MAALSLSIVPTFAEESNCADAWITAKLKMRLMGKSGFGAFKINIDTEGCVVTLEGCVDTTEQRERASAIARKVKKVRDVRNRIALCSQKPADQATQECPDAIITAEVKSLILGTEGFAAFKMNIDTEECAVTLNGCVNKEEQIQEAIQAARKAKWVKDVKSRLTICPAK